MKKTLAVLLSVLVAFSMFAVVASAADTVKVTFVNGGETIKELTVAAGTAIIPDLVPEVAREYKAEVTDENGNTAEYKYTFKGWKSSVDGNIYYDSGIPTPDGSVASITYTAEYSAENYSERQSFWNFIESIFERLNMLFEYFATIFNF